MIPTEKLLINISNPAGALPSIALSNFLIVYPASGPIIIAPINIGISAPTITPAVAIAPITPPLTSPTTLPPVYPTNNGSKYFNIGSTKLANCSLGNHPVSMNNAVINPQAINAPILGITIPLKNLPNF